MSNAALLLTIQNLKLLTMKKSDPVRDPIFSAHQYIFSLHVLQYIRFSNFTLSTNFRY